MLQFLWGSYLERELIRECSLQVHPLHCLFQWNKTPPIPPLPPQPYGKPLEQEMTKTQGIMMQGLAGGGGVGALLSWVTQHLESLLDLETGHGAHTQASA